ncbi:hypothetical protein BOVAC2_1179 [Bacteroides ovatus]|jgi:hypothetical protein|nr:hypothetical protein BOVAC2_1179 [Bacteroides ovatus]
MNGKWLLINGVAKKENGEQTAIIRTQFVHRSSFIVYR